MPHFIDQTGRTISLTRIPQRIISLVPSQTELLADLGSDHEVIGITKFCVHPKQWFRTKTRVGGTKQINPAIIHGLKPDLIIANKEENVKEQIEELEKDYPVWISDVNNLTGAYEMIEQIASITGKQQSAREMVLQIKKSFAALTTHASPLTTAYLIWQHPYMTVGGDTFIHSMLETAGFQNMYGNEKRYLEITIEQLRTKNLELLLLSSEPFPFKQKHVNELQLQLPNTRIMLVDGEIFSWYGSRMLKAGRYFEKLRQEAISG